MKKKEFEFIVDRDGLLIMLQRTGIDCEEGNWVANVYYPGEAPHKLEEMTWPRYFPDFSSAIAGLARYLKRRKIR